MAIGEFQPIDLLGLQGGMGNLPTAANVQALGNQQAAAAAGIDALRANALQQQAQAAQALEAQQRAQQFQADLASHLGDGSPQSTALLMRRYPEFAKQLQEAHLLERDDVRESDVQWMTGVYSRAYNGDWKGAEALARKRLDAERAAGGDTSDEQELVDALASGDPALQKRALGILGMDLAGRVGIDKWNEAYGGITTADGNLVNRGTGQVMYEGKPDVRGVVMAGGVDEYGNQQPSRLVNPVTGETIGGGTVPATGAPATGSRAARNNNPGNLEASEWTKKQPGYVGSDGRFAIFDTPEAGAAAQAALLGNYFDKGLNSVGKIVSRYAPATDGNNVGAYVRAVADMVGVTPGQVLTREQLPAVQAAMAAIEGGGARGASAAPATRQRTQKELAFKYGAPPAGQILTQTGERVRDPLSEKGSGKTLPAPTLEKLNLQAESTAQIRDLAAGFQNSFSGPSVGNATGATNLAGRLGAETFAAQADWWQRMGQFDNVVRNELFGASLTAGEQAAWKATTVTPSMAPARVRANLAKRREILQRALDRKLKTYGAAGYNVDEVGAVIAADNATGGGWSVVEVKP